MEEDKTTRPAQPAPRSFRKILDLVNAFRQLHGKNADAWQGIARLIVVVLASLVAVAALKALWPHDALGGTKGFCSILLTVTAAYCMMFVRTASKKVTATKYERCRKTG